MSEEVKNRIRSKLLGRIITLESRAKRRASLKGNHYPKIAESKSGSKNPNFGKPRSLETRQRMSQSNKGKKHPFSEEARKRHCIARAKQYGSRSPAWKGGITPLNFAIRNSEEYIDWRKQVFERDNYRCQWPGCCKHSDLHAHHFVKRFSDLLASHNIMNLTTAKEYSEFFDPVYGLAVCVPHHKVLHR